MSGASYPLVAVYADESCLGNGREGSNPGGAGGLIEYRLPSNGEIVRHDFWISEPATTNNRMALRSVIEAFRILSAKGKRLRVVFTSDSKYIVQGMREWLPGWVARGWRRKTGEILNEELWRAAAAAIDDHEVDWRWVRGHASHPQNEYANDLAVRAAREQTSSGGACPSGFEAWLAAKRAAGRMARDPDPFPEAATFRPSARLPRGGAARLI